MKTPNSQPQEEKFSGQIAAIFNLRKGGLRVGEKVIELVPYIPSSLFLK